MSSNNKRNQLIFSISLLFLKDFNIEDLDVLLENLTKIKELKIFFKGMVFFNKKSYLGAFSFQHQKKFLQAFKKRKDYIFCFSNPHLFDYSFQELIELERLSLNFFFDKCFIDIENFSITRKNLNTCREKIFSGKKRLRKYLYFSNILEIQNGKSKKVYSIVNLIKKILKNEFIKKEILDYLEKNYSYEIELVKRLEL